MRKFRDNLDRTLRNYQINEGLHIRIAVKKLYYQKKKRKVNRKARMDFARELLNGTIEKWNTLIWNDKSLFGLDKISRYNNHIREISVAICWRKYATKIDLSTKQ